MQGDDTAISRKDDFGYAEHVKCAEKAAAM
jgi:hypothetical protein